MKKIYIKKKKFNNNVKKNQEKFSEIKKFSKTLVTERKN